ncbi:MAG TPA: hypothetical protein VF746_17570 [Longimicrobium sp.]|jgi:hypothetical protein
MNESPVSIPLIILLFLVFFAVLWSGITVLLAYLSGWRALAGRFRGPLRAPEDTVGLASARIWRWAPVRYGSVLNVSAGREGVGLSVFPLFALVSPPLAIPWEAMGDVRAWRSFGRFPRLRFSIADPAVTVTLHGRAADLVLAQLGRWSPERAPLDSR